MAEKTFNDLGAAAALTGSEVIPLWQSGAAKKATPAQLRSWLPDSIADIAAIDPQAATKIYELWYQVAATVPGQVGTVRSVLVTDADHTLTYDDLHSPTVVMMNSAAPRRVFYPSQATVPHALMTRVEVLQIGTGGVTIVGAAGVTVSAGTKEPTLSGQGSSAVVRSTFTNIVLVTGDLLLGGGPQLITPPSINISPVQGTTLTLTPAVCSPDGTRARQWKREHVTTGAQTNIGAGALTYASAVGDIGFYVWCLETITDAQGRSISIPSNKQIIVATGATKPQKATNPSILPSSSHAVDGQTIVDAGDWTNSPTGYKFQRRLNGVNSGGVTNQAGRQLAYTNQDGDAGKNISYSIVAYNGSGDSDDTGVSPDWLIAAGVPQWNGNPVITVQGGGAAVDGCTLLCSDGATNPAATSFVRAWKFIDSITAGGPFSGPIEPAETNSYYTTSTNDINSVLLCDVTPFNADGPGQTVTAVGPLITAAAPPPPPPPPPPPSSTPGNRIAPGSLVPSGPITATSGQVISGKLFSGADPIHITIPPGVTGVLVEDCTTTNATNACIQNQGTDTTVRFCDVGFSARGILTHTGNVTVEYNEFEDFSTGSQYEGHAQEIILSAGPSIVRFNRFLGENYKSDVASNFQSSNITFTDNEFDVQIDEPSGAAFTIGDALNQASPGSNNYVARNTVLQTGGVPAGVFGSNGNTVLEFNCFTAGIQAYDYNGNNFIGVVVRKNVINMGASFTPMPASAYGGAAAWGTNIDSTNCALVPAS